jgi:hypothetical protein
MNQIKISGHFKFDLYDLPGRLGGLRNRLLQSTRLGRMAESWLGGPCCGGFLRSWECPNATTFEGVNDMLTTNFLSGTQKTTWYLGLVDNASFVALSTGDTAAQIGGSNQWIENTGYSGGRPTWTGSTPSAGVTSNASTVNYSINSTVVINGAFLASGSSGTSGVLFSTASFPSTQSLVNGQTLKVTYTITSTPS